MNKNIFIEESHQYEQNNIKLDSLTQAMGKFNIGNYSFVDYMTRQKALERGKDIHTITANYDLGISQTVKEEYIQELMAWQKFRFDYGFDCKEIEQPYISDTYKIGFTPDRIGIINCCPKTVKHNRIINKRIILDIKTGNALNTQYCKLQTAGYYEMYNNENKKNKVKGRVVVWLRQGKYSVHIFNSPEDITAFKWIMNFYWWSKNNI